MHMFHLFAVLATRRMSKWQQVSDSLLFIAFQCVLCFFVLPKNIHDCATAENMNERIYFCIDRASFVVCHHCRCLLFSDSLQMTFPDEIVDFRDWFFFLFFRHFFPHSFIFISFGIVFFFFSFFSFYHDVCECLYFFVVIVTSISI